MDTNPPKTPATLPFAAWRSLPPAAAARAVHAHIARLPDALRTAALAWIRPEQDLALALGAADPGRPLAGVPYLLKDLFDLRGIPTRAGSTFLAEVRGLPDADSAIARRLSAAGAACAGKTHLVEFAAGLFGDNAHYGDCPHPRFPDRLSGGSSSGSAALVAAGVAPLAVGSDTGGSIRVPAAFCGVYGFRLTPGDALIRDAMPLSPSLDTAGWFTAHAADLLATWRALVPADARASSTPRGCHLPPEAFGIAFDPETAAACRRAAAALAPAADRATAAGLLASWQGSVGAYSVTALSEAHRIHRDWLAPYRPHYEPSIWQRFSDGGRYPPAELAAAAATCATVRRSWQEFFRAYDFLVLPCAPFPALRKAEGTLEARLAILALTTPASLGGVPVLTLPVPLPSGLSAGLQVVVPTPGSPVVPWILER
ncbi:MAG: amidase [Opitutaceae bacterium]|nr:amidase [Opitutaceae bacterium]